MVFRRGKHPLTSQQLESYKDNGFLLVSGLIAEEVVDDARRVMAERSEDKRSGSHHLFVDDASVLECFSRRVCMAAAQLAGVPGPLARPTTTYTITVFPERGDWLWPAPHIDHALAKDAHRTFPAPFHIGCLIYLTEVSTHAGATIVWPGSHRELERLARSNPAEYEYLTSINRDLHKVRFPEEPREVLAAAGDVLFYHYVLAHSGSANTGLDVRVALNHKW
jgi:ectoine hydroxylase-related dioxygenase (phytanoyl-CoA dioxygenase family)